MKVWQKIGVLTVLTFFLTGCVNVETNMEIKMNKKMNFEIVMALKKDLLGDEGITYEDLLSDEQKEELTNKGFKVEKYEENDLVGTKIIKSFNNIDYLSSTEDVDLDLDSVIEDELSTAYIFKVEKGFLKNKYYAKYDLDSVNNSNNNFNIDFMNFNFKVTLPLEALNSNATKIENDGKVLIWDLGKTDEPIEFAFEIYNSKNVLAVILSGLIIVLLFINTVLRILARVSNPDKRKEKQEKKKKEKEEKEKTSKEKKNDDDSDDDKNNNAPRFIIPPQ